MQPEILFAILNYGILLPWALLIVLPNGRLSRWLTTTVALPIALGVLYGLIMVLAPMPPGGGDLPSIARVLGSPWGATAMWTHAIAFDLFVGVWIVRDARRRGIGHRWVAPCLLLTLFFGPAGALAYLGGRWIMSSGSSLDEAPS
ncbi:MAG: ABA4-like family protein [Myxococcota bacterium]